MSRSRVTARTDPEAARIVGRRACPSRLCELTLTDHEEKREIPNQMRCRMKPLTLVLLFTGATGAGCATTGFGTLPEPEKQQFNQCYQANRSSLCPMTGKAAEQTNCRDRLQSDYARQETPQARERWLMARCSQVKGDHMHGGSESGPGTDGAASAGYACPMHPDQTSADPNAKCATCGMKLKPRE